MDNRLYWIWLQQALGQGDPLAADALRAFGRPEAIYAADKPALTAAGFTGTRLQRLCGKDMAPAKAILTAALRDAGWVLTPDDAYYPALLRGIYGLPLVLYGRGDMPNLDERPSIAMVGTRAASAEGLLAATRIAAGLAAGGVVVLSGGAVGIDRACHLGALDAGGTTIAVQVCGLDIDYPAENAPLRKRILDSGGVLLSEYPPGTRRGDFHVRNRLLSGLAMGVCICEAPRSSGSIITANHALEQGRDIFALPGDIITEKSAGSNHQIQRGGRLVQHAADILEEYRGRFGHMLDFEACARAEAAVDGPSRGRSQPERRRGAKRAGPAQLGRPAAPAPVPSGDGSPQDCPPQVCPPQVCPGQACPPQASAGAKQVYAALTDTPQPIDDLAQAAGLPPAGALAALTELEVFGCARSYPGQRYAR